jgi:hypothetical protein
MWNLSASNLVGWFSSSRFIDLVFVDARRQSRFSSNFTKAGGRLTNEVWTNLSRGHPQRQIRSP